MIVTFPKPFDMHVHLRQDDLLHQVTPWTARCFAKAVVMPNLTPPIRTAHDVERYRQEIMSTAKGSPDFEPLMTFKILPDTDPATLAGLQQAGVVAGKVYPKGLTTNAEDGVEDYFALYPVFAAMEKLGLVLCLHGEKPGKNIEGLDREREFLRTLFYLARTFPKLRIVMEHITTAAAVDAVLHLPDTVAATITVHHLLLTHDDVGGDRMRPHHYCKPVAKLLSDRDALIEAAISGCPRFFFGSDSAPHPRDRKECSECCAGIFTAPVALPLLAEIFARHNALDRIQLFLHDNAMRFYGLSETPPPHRPNITLVQEPWSVPEEIDGIVPFYAGQQLSWKVAN
jgi:dihydroorotase